ncbi:MAG TPA: hypothetical protein VK204_07065 [Nocardioidaceae bacterium]|nr:hypothetical protein [Nocardioidaceae bacterium]
MSDMDKKPLSADELAAEGATALPDKEVVSLLDLNADLDLAIDAAAPIDLAIAANANVAAPIDAAVGANILSDGSTAQSLADQNVLINQDITADATAHATQDSGIDQSNDVIDGGTTGTTDGTTATAPDGTTVPTDGTTDGVSGDGGALDGATTVDQASPTNVGDALNGDLLDVNVNLDADADIAAPIDGAVAANANVAAPIDAAVSANVGSDGSEATAIAQQDAVINQNIDGAAEATADQASDIQQ